MKVFESRPSCHGCPLFLRDRTYGRERRLLGEAIPRVKFMNISSGIKSVLLFVGFSCALSAYAADVINGTVRNQTSGKAAAGDEVILLRLQNGMEEEAKTRVDAAGAFSLPLSTADVPHIVRVVHQGVNYDQTTNGKGPLSIAVFDAVTHIRGLQGTLGIAQVESDGQTLKVTEMYSIENDSVPPVTQAGPRNFEISIAPKATLDTLGGAPPSPAGRTRPSVAARFGIARQRRGGSERGVEPTPPNRR